MEDKYTLLLQDKDRSDKEQKIKAEIDKNNIIDLNEDIQNLRRSLSQAD